MATAPKIGSGPTAQEKKSAAETKRVGMIIVCGDKEYSLDPRDLGPADDLESRRQTGFPVSPFFESERFGSDSLLVLYWTARRKNGEGSLRFDEVLKMFPTMSSIEEAGFEIKSVDEEVEDDPLGSEEV